MGCRKCGGQPPTPYKRKGFPTITAWGPFPDHCEKIYVDDSFTLDSGTFNWGLDSSDGLSGSEQD